MNPVKYTGRLKMENNKYILELSRHELVMLGHLILSQKLYNSSYEPLRNLCEKIDGLCKDYYVTRGKDKQDEVPGKQE